MLAFIQDQVVAQFAKAMPIHLKRPLGVIEHGVEERRVVIGPFERIGCVGDLIPQKLSAIQILDVNRENFIAC